MIKARVFIPILSTIFVTCLLVSCSPSSSTATNESKTAVYFDRIKHDPIMLYQFVAAMPKGGDLHNHLSGSVYAEDIIRLAANDEFCVNPKTLVIFKNPHCPAELQLKNLKNNYDLYNHVINYWSYRSFARKTHEQRLNFFDAFLRAVAAVDPHNGEIVANLMQRNANEHVDYVELLILYRTQQLLALASQVPPQYNFVQAREYLLAHGAQKLVDQMQQDSASWIATKNKVLHCGTSTAEAGCGVVPRFQFIVLRALPPHIVYAQLVIGFMLAEQDPWVAGINMVGPEDAPLVIENYTQQMQMVAQLHTWYPNVHISLHAGELVPSLVAPEALQSHIEQAVLIAGAQRIGHGSDIVYEQNSQQTLNYMAQHHIPVEICLTSNDKLLNLKGNEHPLLYYLHHQVPLTLATDDEGVLRTDLNLEYQRAVMSYDLNYATLKTLARNALTYSFMPGDSLWQNFDYKSVVSACENDQLGAIQPSATCSRFLQNNAKAKLQWQLEAEFNSFEKNIVASESQ